jgi:hypothetical protein
LTDIALYRFAIAAWEAGPKRTAGGVRVVAAGNLDLFAKARTLLFGVIS